MKEYLKRIILSVLTFEAKLLIARHKYRIILVAGSVGKTSTKDAIYDALSGSISIRKNKKSLNSDFGVPLAILGLQSRWGSLVGWIETVIAGAWRVLVGYGKTEWMVLEVGADHPGDVRNIVSWLKPNIAVLTRMGELPVHIEFFGSRDDLVQEDLQIAYGLNKEGVLVTNADDPDFSHVHTEHDPRVIRYGKSKDAVVRAHRFSYLVEDGKVQGIKFSINVAGTDHELIRRGVVGEHHMYPAMAAVAVALALDVPAATAVEGLALPDMPPGRMRIIEGLKGVTIIDDSYNSSPVAVREALKTLGEVAAAEHEVNKEKGLEKAGRRIAILGDMKELGHHTKEEHGKIGHLAPSFCDLLITVGVASRDTADGALTAGLSEASLFQFDYSAEAAKFIESILAPGDVVLIKGSQSIRMERAVKEIMAHPEDAETLLCRQEEEWLKR
jgi:UDP-N-acetylmuramoyl-tripeptide--D-alanyl-D-alanine ligase